MNRESLETYFYRLTIGFLGGSGVVILAFSAFRLFRHEWGWAAFDFVWAIEAAFVCGYAFSRMKRKSHDPES
jgi:uncharacterized membrane protein YraQ (UPF0718 family)